MGTCLFWYRRIICAHPKDGVCLLYTSYLRELQDTSIGQLQIISPYRTDGEASSNGLNALIRETVNPHTDSSKEFLFGERVFRLHDRVMQTKNNYSLEGYDSACGQKFKGVFNGDIGSICKILPDKLCVDFDCLLYTSSLSNEEWLSYRRRGIGGSDAAAILGISPWRTARDLYYDKLNVVKADMDENWVALEMGHLLEDLVAQIFAKKTGLHIFQRKIMFQHTLYPWMLADLDYLVELPDGSNAILELSLIHI